MTGLPANGNAWWARAIAQELARSGVGHVCLCPGNRSGPLAFACAEEPGLRLWSHVDERSAGFFALGLAKARRAPVALVCTSGTAAANFLPAVVEAWHGRVPLVVLTADRPPDLRDVGANQAIFQAGMYGAHARWSADLALPEVADRPLRHLRSQVCRAVATATGPPAGPVHLNVPFRKPLEPSPVPGEALRDFAAQFPLAAAGRGSAPFVASRVVRRVATAADLAEVRDALAGAHRGLVVIGPQTDPALAAGAARLAAAAGLPLLADPLSGLRFGPWADRCISAYDAVLQSARARAALQPDVVFRLGAAPTSDALLQWLEASGATQVFLDDDPSWRDPSHGPGLRIGADPAQVCEALAATLSRDPLPGGDAWADADAAARTAMQASLRESFTEAAVLGVALEAAPAGSTLVVGNSLAIRDLDRFGSARAKPLRVLGNRGASGIDGMTSTALGVAAAGQGPVLLVTGDLSFYHDLPGLLAFRRCGVAATLLVVHNDGGRIFEQLPAAAFDPPFQDLFVTSHGLDFEPAARMFGASFVRVSEAKALRDELARALAGGPQVVEARVDPAVSRAWRSHARESCVRAVEAAIRGGADAR